MSRNFTVSIFLSAVIMPVCRCTAAAGPNTAGPNDNSPAAYTKPNASAPPGQESDDTKPVTDTNTPAGPNSAEEYPGDKFNGQFAQILSGYVDETGRVDYARLSRYRLGLKAVLSQLAILDRDEYEDWTGNAKKAFWLNTYNLLMLDIITENYPIESRRFDRLWWPPTSIRHIPPRGEVGASKWNAYKFIIMDEEFTLYEIENRFFRKDFADPRAFLALTLAGRDGPPLRNKPYYGKDIDGQLDKQVKRFLSNPNAFGIDRENDTVYLSVLFEPKRPWHGKEFVPGYGTERKFKSQSAEMAAVLNFITNYIGDKDAEYLQTGNYSVGFKAFDWRVNEQ